MVLQLRSQQPIGVFDSGVGGLTVLREVRRQLPNESVVYFGDTARLPYGNRTQAEIVSFVYEILEWLRSQSVKMAIMACNTSSALALEAVRAAFDFPILGIILPGARAAVRTGQRIGVIATTATVRSGSYLRAIAETNPEAQVWQVACPEFVPLIESQRVDDPYTRAIAQDYLSSLVEYGIDTLVFGCTHYPHLAGLLRELLPAGVSFVDPAKYVVRAAAKELELLGLRSNHRRGRTRFYVSGEPAQFAQSAYPWLGQVPSTQQVPLSHVELLS
ncbi:MAG: glutamate racemase [Oscillatoriales cyanobacterium SM2_2_1]|nr:glutamate racemase [Oscillatoriales cyanobacterium SM2_2_1]